ncbi:MAG TPA: hypothetical protein VH500_24200 [Nitrososphaeraceae archaeon]|jgi:hypothetical protein
MDNKNLTITAISALASLLAGCAFMSSEIAFACGHHHSKFILQAAAKTNVCGNGIMSSDINCQNQDNQTNGNHDSTNITGIRPSSSFGEYDFGNNGHNGNTQQHNISPSGSSPSSYIPSGNPITGADP